MKNRLFFGIQRKILGLILSSGLLAFITLFVILYVMHHMDLLPYRINVMLYRISSLNITFYIVLTCIFLIIFFLYTFLFSRHWGRDFEQIMQGTGEISKGNFDYQLNIDSTNELGELAQNIDYISVQLERAINEERQSTRAKNELITNVSHDLRTPLTSIIGYLRLIEEDRYKDEVELRYYTTVAFEKSQRLDRMVNDLFEFTRVNYGAVRLASTDIDLIQLITQLTAQFVPQLKAVGMEVNTNYTKKTIMIKADGDKLARVFENLIANAMKYGEDGRKIVLNVYEEGKMAVIDVVNYGSPIPSMDLPHIFERFYRVEKSRSTDLGGSGLGLAISKSIVELHNGTIKVSSSESETQYSELSCL